ncbi:nucleotidyltransferase domain-containing protein [Streptosporangiaceae bacterium NEAU-GS5]|nr:nucleotidyltransferase domain-containing protein [Streptosporangiaceae bacterium NEAU-GS5]
MSLPPLVQETVAAYLREADERAPGLVEGLYLVGSVALDDFRPPVSDIDFVAVTSRRLDPGDLAALRDVHDRLRRARPRPYFDGSYVTWDDLSIRAVDSGPGAGVHEHRLQPNDRSADPVTWHTLAGHGVACRGPDPTDLKIRTDPWDLAAWTDANLDSYWRPLITGAAKLPTRWGLATLVPYGTVWIVTGVARLHYTLATGGITSKAGAAVYARRRFPERWRRIATEALRLRRGDAGRSLYGTPLARRADVLAFADMVITDAHRVYATR